MKPKIICLDDNKRPKVIPLHLWVKKDQEYTLNHIYWHPEQKTQGFELSEIELTEECTPYVSFSAKRFGIKKGELEKYIQLLKECTDLNDIEINSLIEQEELELI